MKRYTTFLDCKNQSCQNEYTHKTIYRVNAIFIKLPMTFFTGLEQKFYHLYGNTKDPLIAKAILRKKNGAGEIRLYDFCLYYKVTLIKTVWYWQKKEI